MEIDVPGNADIAALGHEHIVALCRHSARHVMRQRHFTDDSATIL